jgi:hypothetical protein
MERKTIFSFDELNLNLAGCNHLKHFCRLLGLRKKDEKMLYLFRKAGIIRNYKEDGAWWTKSAMPTSAIIIHSPERIDKYLFTTNTNELNENLLAMGIKEKVPTADVLQAELEEIKSKTPVDIKTVKQWLLGYDLSNTKMNGAVEGLNLVDYNPNIQQLGCYVSNLHHTLSNLLPLLFHPERGLLKEQLKSLNHSTFGVSEYYRDYTDTPTFQEMYKKLKDAIHTELPAFQERLEDKIRKYNMRHGKAKIKEYMDEIQKYEHLIEEGADDDISDNYKRIIEIRAYWIKQCTLIIEGYDPHES